MKRISISECFELASPIGEPHIKWWDSSDPYQIQRIVTSDGTITWFGIGTNWKKEIGQEWTKLRVDEDEKPTVFIPELNGAEDYAEPHEVRTFFTPCDKPIYEVLYEQLDK